MACPSHQMGRICWVHLLEREGQFLLLLFPFYSWKAAPGLSEGRFSPLSHVVLLESLLLSGYSLKGKGKP